MKTRSLSAIGILIVSVIPAFIGGIWFALFIALVFSQAWREIIPLIGTMHPHHARLGYVFTVLAPLLALLGDGNRYLPVVLGSMLFFGVAVILDEGLTGNDRRDWPTGIGAMLYLVLPAFAAVAIRQTHGVVNSSWVDNMSSIIPGAGPHPAGLALFFTAQFVTWTSDTFQYLVGKAIGRRKLIPRISPNKTIEGAIGGLVFAAIMAMMCTSVFGLQINHGTAAGFGSLLATVGIFGDITESLFKRRAHVKDSSDLIPGHGGLLDRIDALIFVLVMTWALRPMLLT